MNELWGVLAGIGSSLLGGTTVAGTRYLVAELDALSIAALRHSVGALCFLPIALHALYRGADRRALGAAALFGLIFYGAFPWLFALSLVYTTAARGSLSIATFPIVTMALAIALKVETFSWRRLAGIVLAMSGLVYAILPALLRDGATADAWKGDLLMLLAVLLGAIYVVGSRRHIPKIGALPFAAVGVVAGALMLIVLALAGGRGWPTISAASWATIVYLGVFGTAVLFYLWVIAIRHASPALVAMTVPANPLVAMTLAPWMLGEPIGVEVVVGFVLVVAGIVVANLRR